VDNDLGKMNWSLSFDFISGVSVGFEIANGEQLDDPDVKFGICIDIVILRIIFTWYK